MLHLGRYLTVCETFVTNKLIRKLSLNFFADLIKSISRAQIGELLYL